MKNSNKNSQQANNTLLLGGNGKTGHRIAQRLESLGVPVRIGSRSGAPRFDWQQPDTWQAVLQDMVNVYITFYPDLALPGTAEVIRAFTELAVQNGIKRIILLSGRGEEEAQKCEQIVQQAGAEWTILRVSWFFQNFSEAFLRELALGGTVPLPVGDVKEPFIDTDDIADAAVVALTEDGHAGKVYEMTGPELLTFSQAVQTIADETGRDIQYVQISNEDFVAGLEQQQVPPVLVQLYSYLFTTVLDGRNAHLTDGVEHILGRKPRDFTSYVRHAAAAGAWQ